MSISVRFAFQRRARACGKGAPARSFIVKLTRPPIRPWFARAVDGELRSAGGRARAAQARQLGLHLCKAGPQLGVLRQAARHQRAKLGRVRRRHLAPSPNHCLIVELHWTNSRHYTPALPIPGDIKRAVALQPSALACTPCVSTSDCYRWANNPSMPCRPLSTVCVMQSRMATQLLPADGAGGSTPAGRCGHGDGVADLPQPCRTTSSALCDVTALAADAGAAHLQGAVRNGDGVDDLPIIHCGPCVAARQQLPRQHAPGVHVARLQ